MGEVSPANKRLCMVTQSTLHGIRQVKYRRSTAKSVPLSKYIKTNNKNNPRAKFSIVKDYCGHGIGSEFHESTSRTLQKQRSHSTESGHVFHYQANDQRAGQKSLAAVLR
ncbi:hypothetical protein OK016_04730 [Vibrio chagasii]|nr:hypothetical protein [Vibrio chagasii]